MKIWIVDAFATKPYTGNPAGVMMINDFPDDGLCKKIAAEMNLSETAFIKPLQDGTFHIRWFTPTVEVKLCGHATLAAAHILFQEGKAETQVNFHSLSGPLSVVKKADTLTLDFPLQKTGPALSADGFIEILELDKPVVAAVQAHDDILIELETSQDVRNLILDPKDVHKIDCRALIVTAKGDGHYDFISRFFGPRVGVNEDPVTGSAHCKLAHYWQTKLNKDNFHAYQASQRGGELYIRVANERVLISGKAVTIMEGKWLV